MQGSLSLPLAVQKVFAMPLGHDRSPHSPDDVQPLTSHAHALLQVTLPQALEPVQVIAHWPLPPAPHSTSPHALEPLHRIVQLAAPQSMFPQAEVASQLTAQEAAFVQSMSPQPEAVSHAITHRIPAGHVIEPPPWMVQSGGLAVRSQLVHVDGQVPIPEPEPSSTQ
jgi:hypothetical protein